MVPRIFAVITLLIAIGAITAAYNQRSAFYLRQERQPHYWPRRNTSLSGRYRNGVWVGSPSRQNLGGFQGGGPRTGK